ncbi:FAD-dependent oxidoreductase [Ruthenibacterium lactatiformans]|uniref:FAD-dependent oxidoreductase n=1 Tax=Ruthenibacterium lactatiformans TaxID=1550024 RepID=UPI0039A1DD35
MTTVDYKKNVPVLGSYEVVVAGAGPAGICAAVAAARSGARVALVERYGVLGGNLTAGYVGPILGMVGSGTMRDELMALLGVPENDMIGEVGVAHDMEQAKRVLAEFVSCENLDVFLQTPVVDALMAGASLEGLLVATKEGLRAMEGKIVIDATGDGDVAWFAGAPVEKGRADGLMQPVTLEFTLDGVDESRAVACIGDVDDVELNGERFLDYCARCARQGLLPEQLAAVRLPATHRTAAGEHDTAQPQAALACVRFSSELELRRQIDILVHFFRENLPGYEKCRCIASGATLGVRETRRVMEEYTVTAEELAAGKRFSDVAVHKAEFIVDIHNPEGAGQAEERIQYVMPYDLPYRCFVPLKVENLLTAGRCISGTHRAHASYRVMSICMAMGEAVGMAAALCVREGCTPRTLDVKKLQAALESKGVDLYSK